MRENTVEDILLFAVQIEGCNLVSSDAISVWEELLEADQGRVLIEEAAVDPDFFSQTSDLVKNQLYPACQQLSRIAEEPSSLNYSQVSVPIEGLDRKGNRFGETEAPKIQGGINEVSVIRDLALNERKLARKEVKDGGSSLDCSRLIFEGEVCAALDHPSIPRVYEIDRGDTPWIVMDFVEGDDLNNYLRRQFLEQGSNRSRRLILDRVIRENFLQVCNAVAHAHMYGILHCDLKSANVRVGKYGQTVVIDWGSAKRIDKAPDELTDSIRLLFERNWHVDSLAIPVTESHAAPELTNYNDALRTSNPDQPVVDQRADIFSLGKMLQAMSDVGGNQFRASRRLASIIRKSTSHEADDRYLNVEELIGDVRAYLDDEPLSSLKESTLDWFTRLSRKHAVKAVAALIAVLLMLVPLAMALVFAIGEYNRAEKESQNYEQLAIEQSKLAKEKARLAEKTQLQLEQMRLQAKETIFNVGDAIERVPGAVKARKAFVASGTKFLDLLKDESSDAATRLELAKSYETLARVDGVDGSSNLGNVGSAEKNLRSAIDLFKKDDSFEGKRGLVTSQLSLAGIYEDRGDSDKSDQLIKNVGGLLKGITEESAANDSMKRLLLHYHSTMAQRMKSRGKLDVALDQAVFGYRYAMDLIRDEGKRKTRFDDQIAVRQTQSIAASIELSKVEKLKEEGKPYEKELAKVMPRMKLASDSLTQFEMKVQSLISEQKSGRLFNKLPLISNARIRPHMRYGDAFTLGGKLGKARVQYEKAVEIASKNFDWNDIFSVRLALITNQRLVRGYLLEIDEANEYPSDKVEALMELASKGFECAEFLVNCSPDSHQYQRDMAIAHQFRGASIAAEWLADLSLKSKQQVIGDLNRHYAVATKKLDFLLKQETGGLQPVLDIEMQLEKLRSSRKDILEKIERHVRR